MCAPCKQKKLALQARNLAAQASRVSTSYLEGVEFLHLYYIGNVEGDIPSIVPKVSYGKKPYGAFMYVARQDYEAHPDWWTEDAASIYSISS